MRADGKMYEVFLSITKIGSWQCLVNIHYQPHWFVARESRTFGNVRFKVLTAASMIFSCLLGYMSHP
jgi:hypothetical protein